MSALFRRAAGRRYDVSVQESTSLWREPGTASRTVRRKTVLLVADTKWKVAPDGAPSDDDLKQMFVYNELLDAPRAVLLYPSTGPATGRAGKYAERPHGCETMHLGVVAQEEWRGRQMQTQIEALLQSLEVKPNEAA